MLKFTAFLGALVSYSGLDFIRVPSMFLYCGIAHILCALFLKCKMRAIKTLMN
jgi:hypothetical protein